MTPTPPTEPELLARDILAAINKLAGEGFVDEAEDIADAREFADHLIASGWVRWEAAKHVCRDAALNAIYDAIPDLKEHDRVQEFTYYAFDALTPPKGTER